MKQNEHQAGILTKQQLWSIYINRLKPRLSKVNAYSRYVSDNDCVRGSLRQQNAEFWSYKPFHPTNEETEGVNYLSKIPLPVVPIQLHTVKHSVQFSTGWCFLAP